jgi:hypothetical protein
LLIALSKADRLGPAEITKEMTDIESQYEAALGLRCPIDPISTVWNSTFLTQQWFERQLAPRAADHRARTATQLRRKIAVLREQVSATLEARLGSASNLDTCRTATPPAGCVAMSSQTRLEIERTPSDRKRVAQAALPPRGCPGDDMLRCA